MINGSKFAGLALAVDQPARMTIYHPITRQPLRDHDGKECYVDLLSADSAAGRAHDRTTIDTQTRMGGRRMTMEQVDAALTEKLAKLTQGWKLASLDGDPIEVDCTPTVARELYAMPELSWLRAAVLEFVADLGNFRPAASPS
jgi:hypothetical protein